MNMKLLTPSLLLTGLLIGPGLPAQEVLSLSERPAAEPAPSAATRPEAGLRFNFRGAPLETVLKYMSEAAGFVIVLNTPLKGTVDMWSEQPVTSDEAVQLLNLALSKNGYAVTRQGRNLIVSTKEEAKKGNIPIRTGNNPAEIPATAEMVMQIIPLSRIDATQAARDLASLLPESANLTANQDSNSLIVTDTQINVKHIVEIVAALDGSIDTVSAVRVFRLKNADPVEMASLLTNLFQSTGASTAQAGANFPGMPAFLAQRFGGGNNQGGNNSRNNRSSRNGSSGSARSTPVVAVADPRTFSVVVAASKEQLPDIAEMIAKLDGSSARKQKVYVYTLENGDVHQVEAILKNLFQSNNTRSSTSTQADPLGNRATTNSQATNNNATLSLDGNSRGGR
jgi:general secretion pathway protein D